MRGRSGARSSARSRWWWRARRRGWTAASRASSRRRCSTWCATPSTTASRPRRCARAAASRAPGASVCAPPPPGRGSGSRSPTTAPASTSSACASRRCRPASWMTRPPPRWATTRSCGCSSPPGSRPASGGRRPPAAVSGWTWWRRRCAHVLLLAGGALRLALPSAVVRRATRLDDATVVERDGRSFARLPGLAKGPQAPPEPHLLPGRAADAGEDASAAEERLVAFVPLARLYGQTPAERQVLLEGQVSGQPLALVVDDVLREQEVLVRPLTRRVATDHLLEGVALLASGEPVGVLSPAVLAQREYLRALPVAATRAVGRRVRVLLVEDSLVTREMERRV